MDARGMFSLAALLIVIPAAMADDTLRLAVSSGLIERGFGSEKMLILRLTPDSRSRFSEWTTRNTGKLIRIIVDDRVISEPRLINPMTGGELPIPGLTDEEAKITLARLIDGRSLLSIQLKP